MSQLLARLRKQFAHAADPIDRAELQARIGCCLARNGSFDEAQRVVKDLRSGFGDGRSGRVTIWIMLTEGLIHWYSDISPKGLDRIVRAQLLSSAMKYRTGIAVSSAWKAHIDFEMSNFDAMFQALRLSIANTSQEDNDASARVAIVLANAMSLAGDFDGTRFWFMRGRDHALKDGDQASIDALQYNRAGMALAWLRAENCIELVQPENIKKVRLELESAKNLNAINGIYALDNHMRMSNARLLILEEHFDQAIVELKGVRGGHPFADFNFNTALVDLEIAFCEFRLGRIDDALTMYQSIDMETIGDLQIDDRLVAAAIRRELAAADDRFGDVRVYARHLTELTNAYSNWYTELKIGLQKFTAELEAAPSAATPQGKDQSN
jgi:hypothetical protein